MAPREIKVLWWLNPWISIDLDRSPPLTSQPGNVSSGPDSGALINYYYFPGLRLIACALRFVVADSLLAVAPVPF